MGVPLVIIQAVGFSPTKTIHFGVPPLMDTPISLLDSILAGCCIGFAILLPPVVRFASKAGSTLKVGGAGGTSGQCSKALLVADRQLYYLISHWNHGHKPSWKSRLDSQYRHCSTGRFSRGRTPESCTLLVVSDGETKGLVLKHPVLVWIWDWIWYWIGL